MNEKELGNEIKDRLKRIGSKKFKTTMIFPISRFESEFGHLWGHGLRESDLSDDQREYRRKWEMVRREILDTGNHQMRNFFTELDLHHLMFKGYQYYLKPVSVKDNKENNNDAA